MLFGRSYLASIVVLIANVPEDKACLSEIALLPTTLVVRAALGVRHNNRRLRDTPSRRRIAIVGF
jgi:hypothetical protein